jgi:hypothetical protein
MQRDLAVVILYGSIYNQYKIVKIYKMANIIKLSVLGSILSSFIYRCWWVIYVISSNTCLFNPTKCTKVYLLFLLILQPTTGFSLLIDSLLFSSSFILVSPPSHSHYLHIFFDIYNPSLSWSPSNYRIYKFPL